MTLMRVTFCSILHIVLGLLCTWIFINIELPSVFQGIAASMGFLLLWIGCAYPLVYSISSSEVSHEIP